MGWSLQSQMQFLKKKLFKIKDKNIPDLSKDDYFIKCFLKMHKDSNDPNMSFFKFIAQFENSINFKISNMGTQHKHLKNGLNKITEANKEVNILEKKAQKSRAELKVKQSEASKALDTITKAVQEAQVQKSEAQKLSKFLATEEGKIKGKKDQVE